MTPRAEGAHLVCHSCFACQLRNQKLRNKVAYLPQHIQFRHRWNELVFIFHPYLVAGPNKSFQLFRQFLWDGCETKSNKVSAVSHILQAIENGDPKAADELLPLVYEELRKLAAHRMAN